MMEPLVRRQEIQQLQLINPTESGVYRLKGYLECDIELNSDEIPISICATDSDNDGIFDNIDLDLDNDGVLNSVESAGSGLIDFTDPTSPIINISKEGASSGTSISGIISGTIVKTKDEHSITVSATVLNHKLKQEVIKN